MSKGLISLVGLCTQTTERLHMSYRQVWKNTTQLHRATLALARRNKPGYLAGILARLRAMASSTALSCLSSSSRRDSVLLGLVEPEPAAEAEPGAADLPAGAACAFPDDFGGGDIGRFLSPCVAAGRVAWALGRSVRGEGGARPGTLLSRPRSGDSAILLLAGDPGLSLSDGRYLFLLPLSACLLRRVSLMSLWEPDPP